MINGTIENILIRSSLLNILDWISWDLEETAVRVISVPWLVANSNHPFSPVKESRWEVFKGEAIMFWVERWVRNHIEEEEWRVMGVLINIGVKLGPENSQAVIKPIRITTGVKIFCEKGRINGWLGLIRIQFKTLPPRMAVRVIRNIGVIIGKSLSVRFEQGIECFGVHKIIIIMRREYPAVSPVAKKAIKKINELVWLSKISSKIKSLE